MEESYHHTKLIASLVCIASLCSPCLLYPMNVAKTHIPPSRPAMIMQRADQYAGKILPISRYAICITMIMYAFVCRNMIREPLFNLRQTLAKLRYEATTAIVQHQKNREYQEALQKTLPAISQLLYRLPHGAVNDSNARDVAPMIASYLFGPSFKPYRTYTQDRHAAWNSQKEMDQRALQAQQFRQNFPTYICTFAHILWCMLALRTAIAVINRVILQPHDLSQEDTETQIATDTADPDNPEEDPSLDPVLMLLHATYFFWRWNQGLQQNIMGRDD